MGLLYPVGATAMPPPPPPPHQLPHHTGANHMMTLTNNRNVPSQAVKVLAGDAKAQVANSKLPQELKTL